MKINNLALIFAVGAVTTSAKLEAQTVVATDPVGFVSTDLPAEGFTYFGVNLTTPPLLVSSNTTLDEMAGNEVDIGIDLASLDVNKKYFMEIQEKDDDLEGFSVDIDSWTGQVLTLSEDLVAAGLDGASFNGVRIAIREIPTIASIFGAENSAGLKPGNVFGAGDIIYHYSEGNYKSYFYFLGGILGSPEWRDSNNNEAGSDPIHFGDGLIIETRDPGNPKTISISGNVKLGPTNIPIYPGFNLVSNPSPIEGNLTLGNSGLKDSLKQGGNLGDADLVHIAKPEGGFNTYFYFPGGILGSPEWRDAADQSNADDVILPNSGAFFVERTSTATSVTIAEDLPNN